MMEKAKIFLLLLHVSSLDSFLLNPQVTHRSWTASKLFEAVNQSKEALRILVDFHEGTWKGKAASFSVTNDPSAGIRMRKVSPAYTSTINVGLDLGKQNYVMTETMEWEDKMKRRQVSLIETNTDVDTVDGSYSLDTCLPDFPEDIIGTQKLLQFGIEHCVAVNDNARIRAFAFYGIDQSLARIVVCHEERCTEANASSTNKPHDDVNIPTSRLVPIPINILELTSGVWLGSMMLRGPASYVEPKGFSIKSTQRLPPKKQFAKWSIGVQKVALQWKWDLDDSIQKLVTVGNPLGIGLPKEMTISISGIICANEWFATRIPEEQRMMYVDWMGGDQVGFIVNNVVIQVCHVCHSFLTQVLNRSTSRSLNTPPASSVLSVRTSRWPESTTLLYGSLRLSGGR